MTRTLTTPRRTLLYDAVRNNGIHLQATRGSGKSTLEAIIALADSARKHPVVLLEVQGGLVEQLLWRLRFLDPDTRKSIVDRIVYVDMSGKSGRITGWPLLYQLPGDTLYGSAMRFPDLAKRLDPDLTNAPMFGANAMSDLGAYVGVALLAMNCQFTEAPDLLSNPKRWSQRLSEAAKTNPEAEPAVSYLIKEYAETPDHERRRFAQSLRTKLTPFILNPILKAMFGASKPDIDWEEVVEGSKLVILDFQDITSDADVRFKMRWVFSYLWEFIKQRANPREKPISVIVDELSYLLSSHGSSDDLLASDLDNFINKDMRYRNIWLTLAHQELYQIPQRIQKTLLSMGTQIIGQTSDREAAETLANMYLNYDPYWMKKEIPRWAVMSHQRLEWYPGAPMGYGSRSNSIPIMWNDQYIKTVDYVTEEYTLDEQREIAAKEFMNVGKFHFLLATSRDGSLSRTLRKVNILRQVQAIPFPYQDVVARDRQVLIERSGTPIATIHENIRQRQLSSSTAPVRRTSKK